MSTPTAVQPRVDPGIPTGGQWKAARKGLPNITLGDAPPAESRRIIPVRRTALANSDGYIEAAAIYAADDPRSSAQRGQWWDNHWVAAEYQHADGDYPQMPDDFTPARTGGRALSGSRRTHRMAYKSGDDSFAIRMPSATSIKAFETATEHGTFDLPVSAVDSDGHKVAGWVRVTKSGNSWATSELGDFGANSGVQVAEAVSAILEARRPTRALAEAGDLLLRRKRSIAERGVPVVPVVSTFIENVAYDGDSGTMGVQIGKRIYGYKVGRDAFDAVAGSHSPGKAYNALVKGQPRTEVRRCPDCGRFSATESGHECPTGHRERTGARYAQNEAARAAAGRAARKAADPAPPIQTAPVAQPEPVEPAWSTTMESLSALHHLPPTDPASRAVAITYGSVGGQPAARVELRSRRFNGAALDLTDGKDGTPARQFRSLIGPDGEKVPGPVIRSERFRSGMLNDGPNLEPAVVAGSGDSQLTESWQGGIRMYGEPVHGPDPANTLRIDMGSRLRNLRPTGRAETLDGSPAGWTARPEIERAMSRYTSGRYVPFTYDRDTMGRRTNNGDHGFIHFGGLGGQDARRLLAVTPDTALRDGAADGRLTPGTALRAAASHPGTVEVGGSVIGQDRSSESVVTSEIHVYDVVPGESHEQAWPRVQATYGLQDVQRAPTQAFSTQPSWNPDRTAWRFAWH